MAERLGTGLQNRLQQFESAWDLIKTLVSKKQGFFIAAQIECIPSKKNRMLNLY